MGEPETVLTRTFSMEALVLMVSVKKGYKYKREKKNHRKAKVLSVGRQRAWQGGKSSSQSVLPSLLGVLKEASDCTDTWRLKTLLSYTVIPPHKSVLSHPLCTDKAAKHRLILGRSGETFSFFFFLLSWIASLALTLLSHIFAICFSFISSERQTSYFFFILWNCWSAARLIFSPMFSQSVLRIDGPVNHLQTEKKILFFTQVTKLFMEAKFLPWWLSPRQDHSDFSPLSRTVQLVLQNCTRKTSVCEAKS